MTEYLDDITCRELVELVTAYFDGALDDSDRERFEAHLEICDACSDYVAQMRQTAELAGRLEPDDLEPSARDALLATFREWKREQAS
jgi:anti-sigma factor RsiW